MNIWTSPAMEKWGRIGILALLVLPCFLYFEITRDTRNEGIAALIILALTIGIAASLITTEKYTARSLGMFGIILASDLYFLYLYLLFGDHGNHMWLVALTRAMFVVGAPMFAIATAVALIQRTRARRNERRQLGAAQEVS